MRMARGLAKAMSYEAEEVTKFLIEREVKW